MLQQRMETSPVPICAAPWLQTHSDLHRLHIKPTSLAPLTAPCVVSSSPVFWVPPTPQHTCPLAIWIRGYLTCPALHPSFCFLPSSPSTPAAAAAKSLQSCLSLCDPIGGSPPGSAAPGILQARTLGWVAISFSPNTPQFSSVQFSRSVVSDSLQPHELHHVRPPCPSPTPGVYSNSCPIHLENAYSTSSSNFPSSKNFH